MPGEPVTVKQPPAFQKAPLAPAPDADADEEGLATQTEGNQTLSPSHHSVPCQELTTLNHSA